MTPASGGPEPQQASHLATFISQSRDAPCEAPLVTSWVTNLLQPVPCVPQENQVPLKYPRVAHQPWECLVDSSLEQPFATKEGDNGKYEASRQHKLAPRPLSLTSTGRK